MPFHPGTGIFNIRNALKKIAGGNTGKGVIKNVTKVNVF